MKALILNSGLGFRMKEIDTCKCLSELADDGTTILDVQIQTLARCGITDVCITTGAYADKLESHIQQRHPNLNVVYIYNPIYNQTNYIYSMQLARDFLYGNIIVLMHGDLIFEQNVLYDIVTSEKSCMVVDSTQPLPQKDFKAVVKNGRIVSVGVEFFIDSCSAQPLYKLGKTDCSVWLDAIDDFCRLGKLNEYAENALNSVSHLMELYPLDINGRICFEVDNQDDLINARKAYTKMNTNINMPENITQEFLDSIKLPNLGVKRLNYLFVVPRIVNSDNISYTLPYGLCLVTSALKASGRNVFTLNLNHKPDSHHLLKQMIHNNSIDVILTGGLSGQYIPIKEVVDIAKVIKPNIVTCVGGGIITADPPAAMEALENADYGIVGEGEITVNEFAYAIENDLDIEQVEGLIFAVNGEERYKVTLPRSEIPVLDILPFPEYDGFEGQKILGFSRNRELFGEGAYFSIAAGRSCPYNCTFCFHSSGKKYRKRSMDSVLKEIDWVISKYAISNFHIVDEMFIYDRDFIIEFAREAKKRKIKYLAMARVDSVSKEILQMLKDSGCYKITFGVESADNRILKSMRKNTTIQQIDQAFEWALEVGLFTVGGIILGDLEETPETIGNSLNWWKKVQSKYNIDLAWILTFPGTHLYKVACERGIIPDRVKYLKNSDAQINVSRMTDEQYLTMVNRVFLFKTLVTAGIDVDFNTIDDIALTIGKNLDYLVEEHSIALWPITLDIINMLEYISPGFTDNENVFFVNKNPRGIIVGESKGASRGWKKLEEIGKRVYRPDEIFLENNIGLVIYANDYILSSRIYNQIKEAIQTQYHNVDKLIKLTDLLHKYL